MSDNSRMFFATIDCRIDKDEFVLPMIPAGQTVKDMVTERGDD